MNFGLFENPYTDENAYEKVIRCENHKEIALRAAEESFVLIKNDDILPLKSKWKRIALIGPNSAVQQVGGYSSVPCGYNIPTVYDELTQLLPDDCTVRRCDGCTITFGDAKTFEIDNQPHLTTQGVAETADETALALEIAEWSDVIIFVGGDNILTSGEGRDRCELKLNGGQCALIKKLAATGKPMALICQTGKQLDLSQESELCGAVAISWFGGWMGAKAVANAIVGKFSPSGRLPVSLPRSSTRIPCYYSMLPGSSNEFFEGEKNALYGFGHGLSYTSFDYSVPSVERRGFCDVQVSVEITNTGSVAGAEVVQLYIDDVDSSVVTPPLLLKGFKRVFLEPRQTERVVFNLDFNSFKLLNLNYEWTVEPGKFRLLFGASSRDIRCEAEIVL